MFRWFEQRINPFLEGPGGQPPETLVAFYWHFLRQVWPAIACIMIVGLACALIEVAMFTYLGKIVDLVKEAETASSFFEDHGELLLWMGFVVLIARPLLFAVHDLLVNQMIIPSFTNLVRWQTHRYVLRQSLTFFNNDYAGRVANKIMQTGPALRESVVQAADALWFMIIYIVTAAVIFFENDPRLMAPLLIWVIAQSLVLTFLVPRIKDRAAIMSEARSALTGRIVDAYTNILTLKLFAHTEREDDYAREVITDHTNKFRAQMRLITIMEMSVWTINGALIVATGALALWLWSQGLITVGVIALTAGLVIRINNMAGWVMWVVTGIFENIGTVDNGIGTISRPHTVVDAAGAGHLHVARGEIRFENVSFGYGLEQGIVEDLSLVIEPGEKVGVVGRSGAGKSTLLNLLLRFYDLERGRILIDGQDISAVTQDSLRARIGMVTQDSSLLHRSILDNILYGDPEAGEAAAVSAAKKAHAHDFIIGLNDLSGRSGYAALVGERGVKLSGGQRQRIAIARVLLKNAPILMLDEATSALDSEVEAAIQEQFYNLMQGKTVIAIAHRLSTISAMDRLIVMDQGRIVEQGSHAALIEAEGLYARLWARQSGGFIQAQQAAE